MSGCGKATSHERPLCSGRLTIVSDPSSPRVFVGTSGYNYPEWRGRSIPRSSAPTRCCAYYAERFPTVEINYTFYRMPTEKLLAGWAAGTPEHFTFTLKAPRRITHDAKLQRCEDLTQTFCRTAQTLGPKLGALLFQLPPNLKKDVDVLRALHRRCCPTARGRRSSSATRRGSTPEVFDALRARNLALCVADSEKLSTPVEMTADYAYFRLRDEGYQQADIERWAGSRSRDSQASKSAFVYFKHEEQGLGPEFAKRLMALL